MAKVTGGDRWEGELRKYEGNAMNLRVGFFEDKVYPDGTPVAYVAAINEFGATINRTEGSITVYRSLNTRTGEFRRSGRFVSRKKSNFASTHVTPAHQIKIPARPFFRNAVAAHHAEWGPFLAKELKRSNGDIRRSLGRLGLMIEGQIVQSIRDTNEPPNAPSTIRKKGFNKPLIDTSLMIKSVGHEVK